jgi:phytanoyl-CoA hydroxylase
MEPRLVPAEELDAALGAWADQGFARIPAVAGPEVVDPLRERIADLCAGRLPDPGLFFQPDTPSGRYEDLAFGHGWGGPDRDYRKVERLERDPLFAAWLGNPLYRRIATAVLGSPVRLYRAAVFWKAAGRGSDLPFHQDGGLFWGLDREPRLQLWLALDDAPVEAGALRVLPGSHRGGLVTPLGGVVPADRVAAARADERAIDLPARAGDLVLLHNHLWHRSGPNRSAGHRRALTLCLLEGATRCTRRKRAPRAFPLLF